MLVAAAGLGLLIGVVIGALGGGGGVLTVPVLVYVLGQSAQDATTSSVIIVGVAAVFGVMARLRGNLVRWRTGLAFGAVGIPSAALGTLLNQDVAQPVLLLSFAALTVLAAAAMIVDSLRTEDPDPDPDPDWAGHPHPPAGAVAVEAPPEVRAVLWTARTVASIVACGLVIGFLTGFLGVGGGFLIVPALVIVLRMPMTDAIGTSLLIIVINSAAALSARAGIAHVDWAVLVPFTLAAVLGTFAGKRLADRLSGPTLGRAFAVLLLLVGGFVGVESLVAL